MCTLFCFPYVPKSPSYSLKLISFLLPVVPECKGLLCFEKQTENKASSVEADIQHRKMTENHGGHVQVSQRKVITNQRQIFKKSQKYKGNLEDSRFSHAPPNLSTACTSTKSCSASAIAFSQQQMHDTESLAVKLLNELKSMKDIVEEKLLFEAYRKNSLKNDVDEVCSLHFLETPLLLVHAIFFCAMFHFCTLSCI